jgi:hypothetical protein
MSLLTKGPDRVSSLFKRTNILTKCQLIVTKYNLEKVVDKFYEIRNALIINYLYPK